LEATTMKRGKETFTERLQRLLGEYDFNAVLESKEKAPDEYNHNVECILQELAKLKEKNDKLKNMV
jgi:FtsZ-binding cell division protein ZapB